MGHARLKVQGADPSTSLGRPILILEEDAEVASTIGETLQRDGWMTRHAATLAEGFAALNDHNPCIVVVDISLPDGSGMNLVRQASARANTGVIVVSGHSDETDRIIGLEVGADDFISKPFSPREMVARVRALYRRLGGDNPLQSGQAPPASTVPTRSDAHPPTAVFVDYVTLDLDRMRMTGPNNHVAILTSGEAIALRSLIDAGEGPLAREAMVQVVLGRKRPSSFMASFMDRAGLVDVDRVAEALLMSKGQLAHTIGLGVAAISKGDRKATPKVQSRVTEMLEIITRVSEWAGGRAQAMAWYRAQAIPALDGRTAEALVKDGQAHAVREYLDHVALGGFA